VEGFPVLQHGLWVDCGIEGSNRGEEFQRSSMRANAKRAAQMLRRPIDAAQVEIRAGQVVVRGRVRRFGPHNGPEYLERVREPARGEQTTSVLDECDASQTHSRFVPPLTLPDVFLLPTVRSRTFRVVFFGLALLVAVMKAPPFHVGASGEAILANDLGTN
jgi:hypothetical protein